jgi:hypothetical protein
LIADPGLAGKGKQEKQHKKRTFFHHVLSVI